MLAITDVCEEYYATLSDMSYDRGANEIMAKNIHMATTESQYSCFSLQLWHSQFHSNVTYYYCHIITWNAGLLNLTDNSL